MTLSNIRTTSPIFNLEPTHIKRWTVKSYHRMSELDILDPLQLPVSLYEKLQTLATEENTDVVGAIAQFVTKAYQQKQLLQDLTALRQQIQTEDGLQIGETKEAIVSRLHQTRQEIFEAEYAHLFC